MWLYGVWGKLGPCQGKRDGTEVGMHGGASGAVSGDDNGIGELVGKTDGDDRVRWMGQVVCINPYVFHMLIQIEFLCTLHL